MIDKNDQCIRLIFLVKCKNRLFLIIVADCFSDGLCLVESEAMLMTFTSLLIRKVKGRKKYPG